MTSSALRALESVLDLKPADTVLILTDEKKFNVARAFHKACELKGCSVDTYKILSSDRPLKEIPARLNDMLRQKTVVLNILEAYPEEIGFRIKWIFKTEATKIIRAGHMPGVTESMLTDGPMNIDYRKMLETAENLILRLKDAALISIKTSAGTDLIIGVKERTFRHDLKIGNGETGNLPCGEVYCAPEENNANGKLVIDASIGDIGLLKTPLIIKIENGRIISFESEDSPLVDRINFLTGEDIDCRTIGELGIGVNPGARILGNMLEDEKAFGTAHIAFGNNEDFGGINSAKIHRDFLFRSPEIHALLKNGSSLKLQHF